MNSVEGQVVENLANGKRKVDWIRTAPFLLPTFFFFMLASALMGLNVGMRCINDFSQFSNPLNIFVTLFITGLGFSVGMSSIKTFFDQKYFKACGLSLMSFFIARWVFYLGIPFFRKIPCFAYLHHNGYVGLFVAAIALIVFQWLLDMGLRKFKDRNC